MAQWSKRTGIMLAYPYNSNRLKKQEWQKFIVQPKLNGLRCRVKVFPDRVDLISSECNLFKQLPHIEKALLHPSLVGVELDGELYTHGLSWSDIVSISSREKNPHPNHERLELHLFDIIDEQMLQVERLNLLYIMVKPIIRKPVCIVESTPCTSEDMAYALLTEYMKEGYEGVVLRTWLGQYVRRRNNCMQKWKPRKSDCYPIIGFEEEIDQYGVPKGMLGALICETDGVRFNVSAGSLDHSERRKLFESPDLFMGKYCLLKYTEMTINNIPNHAVLIEISDSFIETDDEYID